ncbi:hypothetical protein UT300003_31990 [Clostridium sardiniense]
MGGRPRKSTTALQGNVSKGELKSRLEIEKKITGNSDNIVAPDFIKEDEIALGKFNELVTELTNVGIITNVDTDLLAVYSDSWAKYVRATMMLAMQDMVEEQENKLGSAVKVINPYIRVQDQYSNKLLKLSSLFGLSPADRSKIAHLDPSDKEDKPDPLLDLIKGIKKKGAKK